MLQLPWKCANFIPHVPGPATHNTTAGRVLDGVRDPTQRSASLAFSCTGPGLVPVLPARCHRCSSASGSLRSGGRVLYFPNSYKKTVWNYSTNDKKRRIEEWMKLVALLVGTATHDWKSRTFIEEVILVIFFYYRKKNEFCFCILLTKH